MAVGTADYAMKNLGGKTNTRRSRASSEVRKSCFSLRFQSATSQLENAPPAQGGPADIARMYTILREREARHQPGPEATETKAEESNG